MTGPGRYTVAVDAFLDRTALSGLDTVRLRVGAPPI